MKSKLLLSVAVIFGLTACEDLTTVDIDTTLSKTLTVDIADTQTQSSVILKSAAAEGYPFYKTDVIDLSENEDLKDKLNDIKEMEVYKVKCKLNGIPTGESILELTVFSTTAGLSKTLTNLTDNNSTYELEVSGEILKALGEKLMQYKELEVGISGYSSYAPMTLSVKLDFDTKVKAKVI